MYLARGRHPGQNLQMPVLYRRALSVSSLYAARFAYGDKDFGMTPVAPCDDAYFMSVKLRPMSSGRMWLGERLVSNLQMQLRLFATCFAHLSDQPHSEMLEPFDLVRFHVPRSTLKQFIDDQGSKQIDALRCPKP